MNVESRTGSTIAKNPIRGAFGLPNRSVVAVLLQVPTLFLATLMLALSKAWYALSPSTGQSGQGERKAEDEESAELPQAVAFFSSQGRRTTDLEN